MQFFELHRVYLRQLAQSTLVPAELTDMTGTGDTISLDLPTFARYMGNPRVRTFEDL